jgi:hypothetical protein
MQGDGEDWRKLLREAFEPARNGALVQGNGNLINTGTIVVHSRPVAAGLPARRLARNRGRDAAQLLLDAIRKRALAQGLSEAQLLERVSQELRPKLSVTTLNNLSARELGQVYQALLKMKRRGPQ